MPARRARVDGQRNHTLSADGHCSLLYSAQSLGLMASLLAG